MQNAILRAEQGQDIWQWTKPPVFGLIIPFLHLVLLLPDHHESKPSVEDVAGTNPKKVLTESSLPILIGPQCVVIPRTRRRHHKMVVDFRDIVPFVIDVGPLREDCDVIAFGNLMCNLWCGDKAPRTKSHRVHGADWNLIE